MIPAGAGNTVQIEDHMTEFTADPMATLPDLSVNDDTAADAGADRDEHAGGSACADTGDAFRQGGNVGVIIDENRFVVIAVEYLTEKDVMPSHVGTFDDFTGIGSDTRDADTDRFDSIRIDAGRGNHGQDAGRNLPNLFLKIHICPSRDGSLRDDL